MTLRLSDRHESMLHVTLGRGESALDVYRALRKSAGRTTSPTHISIVDVPRRLDGGAMNVPSVEPTAAHSVAATAAHSVAASPVDERPSSPSATPNAPALPPMESDLGPGLIDDLGSLSPAALSFSSEDEVAEDELMETMELGTIHSALVPREQLVGCDRGVANTASSCAETEELVACADCGEADATSSPAEIEEQMASIECTTVPLRVLALADLPPELLVVVLSWLEGNEIAEVCTAVCKSWWHVIAQSKELWRVVCVRRFPWHAAKLCVISGQSQSWCQLFKDEWLWARRTADGPLGVSVTSDQRSRYSTEVINATERPMALNVPPLLRPAVLPERYSGVVAAVARSNTRAWEGSIGRGFCVVESTGEATLATSDMLFTVSATNESSPQVIHRQSLDFDLSKRVVSAAQEVTRCVSRFSSVPTCARRRDFAFDRLLLSPPLANATGPRNEGSSCSFGSEAALQRLTAALAPAARQFGGTERRGGCMLCCGTATSGKEHFLDLGMRRSPSSTPGLAAAFFSELFVSLGTDLHTGTTELDESLKEAKRTQLTSDPSTTSNGHAPQCTVVKVGILCSNNGDLTDVAALCSSSSLGGSQRVDVQQTSPGIRQCMIPVTSYAEAIGLCMSAVSAEERRQANLGISHPDGRRSDSTITIVTIMLQHQHPEAVAQMPSQNDVADSQCFEIVEWLGAEPRSLSTNTPLDRTRYAEAKQPSTFLRDLILRMSANSQLGDCLLRTADGLAPELKRLELRLRRPDVNNAFIGCHRLGLFKSQQQGYEKTEADEPDVKTQEPQEEAVRASLLDEVGVLYFVAKAREAFQSRG